MVPRNDIVGSVVCIDLEREGRIVTIPQDAGLDAIDSLSIVVALVCVLRQLPDLIMTNEGEGGCRGIGCCLVLPITRLRLLFV